MSKRSECYSRIALCVKDSNDLTATLKAIENILSEYDIEPVPVNSCDGTKNREVIDMYVEHLTFDGYSPLTIKGYKRQIKLFLEFANKDYDLVTHIDIRNFMMEKQKTVCGRTLNTIRLYIHSFYTFCVKEELMDKNPCDRVKQVKFHKDIKTSFTKAELSKMRDSVKNDKERAILEVLISTGVRVSELCSLKVSDLNFDDLSVHVTHGKGNKERNTYMTDECAMYVRKYLRKRKKESEFLFVSKNSQNGLSASGVRYILSDLSVRSGVPNVHPHRFRRTFATMLSDRGMGIEVIKMLMGHTDIGVTSGYISLSDRAVRRSYEQYIA